MDHVFIGTKSVILPNVRIGSNVIIAAGSIVTKDLDSGGVYAGNPAKRIGDFGNILDNRLNWTEAVKGLDDNSLQNYLWDDFLNKRK